MKGGEKFRCQMLLDDAAAAVPHVTHHLILKYWLKIKGCNDNVIWCS